jgi:hypothetical protein
MGEVRNTYKMLIGKPEGKRPPERHRSRWKDKIGVDFRGIWLEGVVWLHVT